MGKLSLNQVSLSYPGAGIGHVGILHNVTLSLDEREFVVVIGRSGSGKTSLLNLAAGFLTPSHGSIAVDGAAITGPGSDRAVVFQDDALYPWLNARDNIGFPLKLRHVAKRVRDTRAEELLDLVGLSGSGDKKIWELSGGMRQRVGIARALASDPKFLLMDEPLGALDALTRSRMQSFLLNVWQATSTGVLLITHSIDEALFLATRVIVLEPTPGRITADIPLDFGRRHLAGESAASIRSSSAFKTAYERLTLAIHTETAEFAA
ncbi:taurine ABC transporter ATP-binding protein [Rhizobium setariae]|uniref:taurine ABC transporter ATP-binding protein n=1 Tax=Rhizobium setariae TaxID=2801340 RepID=UPI001FEFDB2A|nr:ABC transporter ATP-binding protein [Rhizobium setariae]